MAEYGKSIVETNSIQRTPPVKVFGIVFGEESYLDYPPNTKLKVPQNDLLVFFRQMAVMLKSGVPLSQGLELLAENMTNKEFGACIFDISKKLNSGEELSSCLNSYPRIFAPINAPTEI